MRKEGRKEGEAGKVEEARRHGSERSEARGGNTKTIRGASKARKGEGIRARRLEYGKRARQTTHVGLRLESDVHNVAGDVGGVRQVPQQVEHLGRHLAVGVVRGQLLDKLEQVLHHLRNQWRQRALVYEDGGIGPLLPTMSAVDLAGPAPAALEAAEEVVQLRGRKVPRQLGEQAVHVGHDRVVLPNLRVPGR